MPPRLAWLRFLNVPLTLVGFAGFRSGDVLAYVVLTVLLTAEWPFCIQLAEGVEVYLPVTWSAAAAAYVLGPMILPVVFVAATAGFFLVAALDGMQIVEAKGLAGEALRRLRGLPSAPGSHIDGLLRQFVYLSGHAVRVALAWALPEAWGFFGRVAAAELGAQLWVRAIPIAGQMAEARVQGRFAAALGLEALFATRILHVAVVAALLLAYREGGLAAFVVASLSTIALHVILHGLNQTRVESERRRLELAAMREELDRRERLAAIGQTASTIFHQIGRQHGVIGMFAHLLARDPGPAGEDVAGWRAQVRAHAQRILGSVEEANRVIDELRRFSEDRALNLYAHAVVALAEECVAECLPRARRTGVSVRVTAPADALVLLDKHKLRQALGNLIDNAIDASPPGAVVELGVVVEAARVVLRVRDHGTGVAPHVRARLFTPFCTTKRDGIGLGLALAREIVEAHDGTISWMAADPGTTFQISLPRAPR